MSLLIKGGITKLSELTIDADKDWQAKEIQNLKGTAASMVRGDITARKALVLERLAASYGVGYNFFHVKDGTILDLEWLDIQDIIAYISGGVNRMIALPTLVIPAASISLVVTEDHSGGGFTADKTLAIPAPVLSVVAAESWLLVEDCEDAWNEYVQGNVTSTADGVDFKVGTASAKLAVADLAAVGRLATEAFAPLDLSPYKYLKAWVKSTVAINSGDISILLDDTPACVSPLKDLNIGALAAGVWTQVTLDMGDTAGLGAIISVGIDMDVDKGVFDFWIDQVRATKGP